MRELGLGWGNLGWECRLRICGAGEQPGASLAQTGIFRNILGSGWSGEGGIGGSRIQELLRLENLGYLLHPSLPSPPRQELELQAQIHGLPLTPPMAEGGSEEPSGGAPFPPTPGQCLLELPPGLALPLALGGPEGTLEDILMDEGGALSPLGPPGALLASPGPSRASSPRSSLSMEDEP